MNLLRRLREVNWYAVAAVVLLLVALLFAWLLFVTAEVVWIGFLVVMGFAAIVAAIMGATT